MTARDRAAWPPSVLLLLRIPGCFSLSGPSTMNSTVGGSLSVQCRYEEEYRTLNKLWCRKPLILLCDKIVETKKPEREVRSGRVSIRDHPAKLTFTVTVRNLTVEDTGTYWCGVETPWLDGKRDPVFQVEVSVFPAPVTASSPGSSASTSGPATSLPVSTWDSSAHLDPSPHPRYAACVWDSATLKGSLLGRKGVGVRFMFLIFLEVPLLLSMLGAVLWVNRPQRRSKGSQSQMGCENQ
ncbi:PREDICTED: CMRF35-like molecule 6 [Galeopterus variegatus]|uniref:CMRF35-like molecule 6 n=1 Tax=Galeopterus variegatus TaxID=482537 RepID=A0ABM0RH05_GALVR|nr:PREDICTED: CMRF35-like molecule 6 [Galeopterus variegatus]